MAPHVSRFVTRLFDVEPRLDALRRGDARPGRLFRFKIDFVRRRALPLLKAGAQVTVSAADDAAVQRLVAAAAAAGAGGGADQAAKVVDDLELAIARAGCALLDREKAGEDVGSLDERRREPEAVVRGPDARPRVSRLGRLPVSRERSTTGIWSTCSARIRRLPEAMLGSRLAPAPARRLRADRRADDGRARC